MWSLHLGDANVYVWLWQVSWGSYLCELAQLYLLAMGMSSGVGSVLPVSGDMCWWYLGEGGTSCFVLLRNDLCSLS